MTTREEAHKVIDAVFDNERRAVIVLVAPPDWSPEHAGHWRDVVQAALDEDRGMFLATDGVSFDARAKPSPSTSTVDLGEAARVLERETR